MTVPSALLTSKPTTPPPAALARRLLPAALAAAVVLGLLAGLLASGGQPVLALLLPLLLVPVLLWTQPKSGLFIVFAGTVVIEQYSYMAGPRDGAITGHIPLFRTVSAGSLVAPVEVLLVVVLTVWVLKSVQRGTPLLRRSAMGSSIAAFCGFALFYFGLGLKRSGDLKAGLWEVKPFFYLAVAFVLASSLLTTQRAIRVTFWILVVGSGLKAMYGLVIFVSVRHMSPPPEAVLAHEESFFFGLYVFLAIGLWAFGVPGRLRKVTTALLPFVVMADMVNSRRTAWAVLILGIILMAVIAYIRSPTQRKGLRRTGAVMLILSTVYLPAYWNKSGSTAQPARAIRSVVAPSTSDNRDAASDTYRVLEDVNLEINIRASQSVGSGFGRPINYVRQMVDLTSTAPMLAYVPHDGVLWIWMRMGIIGEVLLWTLIAQAMIAACRLSRVVDREAALLGALVACAVTAYVIMGAKDLGFYWLRLALCMGVLLGAVEARARVLERQSPEENVNSTSSAARDLGSRAIGPADRMPGGAARQPSRPGSQASRSRASKTSLPRQAT